MIGICTPFKIDNYGTKLQAYAVQEKFVRMGYEVEVINFDRKSDFRPVKLYRRYLNKDFMASKWKKHKKNPSLKGNQVYEGNLKLRRNAINSFDAAHYHLTPLIKGYGKLSSRAKKYSAVICGSDQIWLPTGINNPTVTLEFAPVTCRRIAFSPSFGIEQVPERLKKQYSYFLKKFDFLSVREQQGGVIIENLIGKEVPVTLDPTLTVNLEVWDELRGEGRELVSGDYVFCYFLGNNEEHRKSVYRFAQENGWKIVTLPHFKGYIPADEAYTDIRLYDVTPCDFIKLIYDAKVVCTDSFHATVFSILYHKDFFTFERFKKNSINSANSRIYSLLGQLGLTERIVDTDRTCWICPGSIRYDMVEQKLEGLRRSTDSYLLQALAGIEIEQHMQ